MRNPCLAGLVLIVLASFSLQAAVLRVPSEYASIQEAIDSSAHGDTVIVSPGLYYERINFNGKNITVTSTDPNNSAVVGYTILNAEGEGPVVTFENGESFEATLTGFTLTGGLGHEESYISPSYEYHQYYGAGIYCRYGSPTITHNVIVNNVSPYVIEETIIGGMYYSYYEYSYGGGIYYSGSGKISHNIIYNNSASAGAGIYITNYATVSNNLIYNNSAAYGGGAYVRYGILNNNTIVGNNTDLDFENDGLGGSVYAIFPEDYTSLVITNNIIANAQSGGGLYANGNPGDSIRYNDVWGNSPVDYIGYIDGNNELLYGGEADFTGLFGNISEDPMLMTAWNKRYHLDPESPCISAGDPNYVSEPGETDIDGDPRIYALIVDIGADEHIGYVKPLANAGDDVHVLTPVLVELDGTGSYFSDPMGVKTYQWSQVLGPTVTLDDTRASNPSFTPPELGWYKFQLIVADGQYTSGPDTVLVVVGNEAPIANAGPDKLWEAPGYVMLDGLGSSDADPPDELTFSWTQIEGPTTTLMNDANSARPWFLTEGPGVYVFELVVNDGFVDSQPDRVKIETSLFTVEAEAFTASQRPPDDYQYFFYPDVSGTSVVYVGGEYTPSYWSVYWTDSQTGETLTFDAGQIDTKPRVDGDIVVWMGGSGYYYQPIRTSIYAVDIKNGQKVALQRTTGRESYGYPAISGNTVVWLQYRDVDVDDYDGYADRPFDICGADITDLDNPVYFTLVTNAGRGMPYHYNNYTEKADSPLDICGHIIVWESEGDIYGADISNLDDIKVFPICTDDEKQMDPAISGDRVVWWDQRNDLGDIYGADISDRDHIRELEIVVEYGTQLWPVIDGPMVAFVDGNQYGGYLRTVCLSRQYGAVDFAFPDLPDYPYVYDTGLAISGSTIAWSDWDYEVTGARLDFAYSVVEGPIQNSTTGTRHDYLQHAVTAASDGDVIMLEEGVYREKVRFSGRNVTLTSTDPTDPAVRAATVITGPGPLVTFADGETSDCLLTGLTVIDGTFGVICNGSSPTITHCDVIGHVGSGFKLWGGAEPYIRYCTSTDNGIGVEMWADTSTRKVLRNRPTIENCVIAGNRHEGILGDLPTVKNCTIAENLGYGLSCIAPTITNSIVYFNNAGLENLSFVQGATITYSDVQGGAAGQGNIDQDPLFRLSGLWSDPADPLATWTPGDYHLKSQGWSWDSLQGDWTWDDVTSPCIDAGDPSLSLGDEVPCEAGDPLSERAINLLINIGAYGGTAEASLAPKN